MRRIIEARHVLRLAGALLALSMVAPVAGQEQDLAARPLSTIERSALFAGDAEVAAGREVVAANCASCHGLDGIATDPQLPNLAAQRTVYLYRQSQAYRQGMRSHPVMRKSLQFIDDGALLNAAVYYGNLEFPSRPEPEPEAWLTDDDPLRATRAATAGCGSCHGPEGNSRIPGMPSLTAQHPDYFVTAMEAYQAGERTHNMMQMLVATLDAEAIRNMGIFYALQEPKPAAGGIAGDSDRGRSISEPCAGCHGADGNASSPQTPSLAGQDPRYLVASMNSYLQGARDHQAMEDAMAGFSSQDVSDMAAYYSGQQPLARAVKPPLSTGQWLQRCARCHGQEGNSPDPRQPSLAGQNAAYFIQAMQAYASGERRNRTMHAMSEPLSGTDIERLAAYYEARTPDRVIYLELPCDDQGSEQ